MHWANSAPRSFPADLRTTLAAGEPGPGAWIWYSNGWRINVRRKMHAPEKIQLAMFYPAILTVPLAHCW